MFYWFGRSSDQKRPLLVVVCALGLSTYFYKNKYDQAMLALNAKPKTEENSKVKESRAEVKTVKKYKDGKLDEVTTIKGPVVKETESEKKVTPVVLPVRTDRILLGPMVSNYGLGLTAGYSFNNRLDLTVFSTKNLKFYGGNLVFRF